MQLNRTGHYTLAATGLLFQLLLDCTPLSADPIAETRSIADTEVASDSGDQPTIEGEPAQHPAAVAPAVADVTDAGMTSPPEERDSSQTHTGDLPQSTQPPAAAADAASTETGDAQALQEPAAKQKNFLDASHTVMVRNVQGVALGIDRFFGGDPPLSDQNESYVNVSFRQIIRESGDKVLKEKIKIRLDLPNTEKRLKLVFETDPDDLDSLDNKKRDADFEDVRVTKDESASGALRFIINETSLWQVNLDTGVRTPLPLNAFARLKLRRRTPINELWLGYFRQSFYYYHQDGWGANSSYEVGRPIGEHFFFDNEVEVQFTDERNLWEFSEIAALHQRYNSNTTLSYALGILADSQPRLRTTSYFAQFIWRRDIYDKWVYVSLTPEIAFPREEDFSLTPSITAKIEFLFDPSLRH